MNKTFLILLLAFSLITLTSANWCNGADTNKDGIVNAHDFMNVKMRLSNVPLSLISQEMGNLCYADIPNDINETIPNNETNVTDPNNETEPINETIPDINITEPIIIPQPSQHISSRSSCVTKWECSDWSSCTPSGNQYRSCDYKENWCKPRYDKPIENQTCVYVAPVIVEVTPILPVEDVTEVQEEVIPETKGLPLWLWIVISIAVIIVIFILYATLKSSDSY